MAKKTVRREVPVTQTAEQEIELPENHPAIVHERFRAAHKDGNTAAFAAASLRKVAQQLHKGLPLPRALEAAAEEIESLATEDEAPSEDEIRAQYEKEKRPRESFDDFARRILPSLQEPDENAQGGTVGMAELRGRYERERNSGESFDAFRERIIADEARKTAPR